MSYSPQGGADEYPMRLTRVQKWGNGAITTTTIKGAADTSFMAGDTAMVIRVRTPDSGDSTAKDSLALMLLLGANPRDSLDDSLLSAYILTEKRQGVHCELTLSLTCEPPIGHDQRSVAGEINYHALRRVGGWLDAIGSYSPDAIEVLITTRRGDSARVIFDRDGDRM